MVVVKNFRGHSGAIVNLIDDNGFKIEKYGNSVDRNYSRMLALRNIVPQPELLDYKNNTLTMKYVPSIDMGHYLIDESVTPLISFIDHTYKTLEALVYNPAKDYYPLYETRLSAAEWLPARFGDIIDILPRYLPQTEYHGDFTLNNILYDYKHSSFLLIDGIDTDFDSVHFDLSKLRQDLDFGWFIRDQNLFLDNRLHYISKSLEKYPFYNNNGMAILCLLRIWNYSNKSDKNWLMQNIEKLWSTR